eukprot:SAG11_NODE_1186_length_5590_cov_2.852850_1_plen_110_part_00
MDYSLLLGIKQRLYPVNELHPQPAPGGGGAASNPVFREDEGGINACLVVGPGTYYIGVIDLLQVRSPTASRAGSGMLGSASDATPICKTPLEFSRDICSSYQGRGRNTV